ncbi:MAG: NAD(P)H-hydrate epimerase [Planctomycetota bacterium]
MTTEHFLNRHQSRQVDEIAIRELGIPGIVLMENAGRGVVEVMQSMGINGPVAIACGKGNNGGDGFVIARHLLLGGFQPKVWVWANDDEYAGDAAINLCVLQKAGVTVQRCDGDADWARFENDLNQSDWIIDAILGTGAKGAPRAPYDRAIQLMNQADVPGKLAIDIPSGLDCDTGKAAQPTFRASRTCTFVTKKSAFAEEKSAAFLGKVHTVDIGVPVEWVISRL